MKQFESEFKGYQGQSLFYQTWEPSIKPKAWFIITHGQGEHSSCYQRFVEGTSQLGFNTIAWDLRGHGRSFGKRGYAHSFYDYVEDFKKFNTDVAQKLIPPSTPVIYVGHSMGGLIQLTYLLQVQTSSLAYQILSNPLLGLSLEVPAIKELAAIALNNYFPKVTLGNEILNTQLSSDPDVLAEYEQDILRHHKISSGVYLDSKQAQKNILDRSNEFKGHLLMLLAQNDPIVSSSTNIDFFNKLKFSQKKLNIYENRKHELFNDLGREAVFNDINQWCTEVI